MPLLTAPYPDPVDVPIACSLEAAAAHDQLDTWRALLSDRVVAVTMPSPVEVRMELQADDAALAALVALARREAACCPFFRFGLEVDARATVLTVAVPGDAVGILDDFVRLALGR